MTGFAENHEHAVAQARKFGQFCILEHALRHDPGLSCHVASMCSTLKRVECKIEGSHPRQRLDSALGRSSWLQLSHRGLRSRLGAELLTPGLHWLKVG